MLQSFSRHLKYIYYSILISIIDLICVDSLKFISIHVCSAAIEGWMSDYNKRFQPLHILKENINSVGISIDPCLASS